MLSRFCHQLILQGSARDWRGFQNACADVEITQRGVLARLLALARGTPYASLVGLEKINTYEEFRSLVQPTNYVSLQPHIEAQMGGASPLNQSPCSRYQPTSGSTSNLKWIPYTKDLLREFDRAAGAWICDLGRTYPGVKRGKHYWALSWLPTEMRAKISNNDADLFPWWKRALMKNTMAVPPQVALASTSAAAQLATAAFLCAEPELSFMSIWSPTYGLSLLRLIEEKKQELVKILSTGEWGESATEFGGMAAPKNTSQAAILSSASSLDLSTRLWRKLALVSAWDTASSKAWAVELKKHFPQAAFQGKGLWATECVVTIPFAGKYPVAVTSHFYEFKNLATGSIHPLWELEKNWVVQPIVSTGSGFWRYALSDRLRVTDFIDHLPCLEFEGRLDGTDLVGEKISPSIASALLDTLNSTHGARAFTFAAVTCEKPFYVVLSESGDANKLAGAAEIILSQSFHYELARELGQLGGCRVKILESAPRFYESLSHSRGQVLGNLKAEPLIQLTEKEWFWIQAL